MLVLGGEATSWSLVETVEALAPECRLFNHYGPTEATIGATAQDAHAVVDRAVAATLPIGRPLAGYRVYLLDARLRPVPPGEGGELFIGGAGLARGYLGRPGLTAQRFLPAPFAGAPGERLYRTGDLARLLPGGSIEFLGRVDHQVKIHGFRVELGEISSALDRHPGVWESVAVLREDTANEKHLVAYVVPRRGRTLDPGELRAGLAEGLPEYMLPAAIVLLKALPLTPNGKVDLRALPAPERSASGERIVAPRTPAERALVAVWSEVLGISEMSVEANFFELGGDSILAIQVAARAHREGYLLNPKQIFEHQTIARLAAVAAEVPGVQARQGLESGPVPLTPIQSWFFAQGFADSHHWNQSLLMEAREPLSASAFERLVAVLTAHHDALRLRFAVGEGRGWRQWIAGSEAVAGCSSVVDLSALPAGRCSSEIESSAARVQGSLDLERGPIARFVLFDVGPREPQRLLAVIHHLAVDGVSWRILIEDLQEGWPLLARGEVFTPAAKSSSVKQWAERLAEYARSEDLEAELPVWLALAAEGRSAALPRDFETGDDTLAGARGVTVTLDAEHTQALLKELPAAYGTEIDDALLTALARGFARWTGSRELWVDLEGHGREPLFDDLDLSRTVGWFTTHVPVRLEVDLGARPGETLLAVKERLRRMPGRGIGYGILRELGREEAATPLRALPQPEVKLNYLGQLDRAVAEAGPFGAPRESPGQDRSGGAARPHLLEINGGVVGGCLRLSWTYSERRHRRETIETLAANVLQELATLVDQGRGAETYSVSDFPLARLDEERLARLLTAVAADADAAVAGGRRRIEDVYPVSPLQESLLVSALASGGSGAGFEQKSTTLAGELDLDAFARTWREMVSRHPILRTSFFWDGVGDPLQVVWREASVPIEELDWSGLTPEKQRFQLQGLLRGERERGFDPGRAPLQRLVIIRLGEGLHQIVWSYHHLLLDAWCRNLVLQEVFLAYDAFRRGGEPELPECRPYRDYIAWLAGRDAEAARTFWAAYLKGFRSPSPLPRRPAGKGGVEHCWLRLSAAATEALEAFGRRHQVTLGTLVQAAWALLLGRYAERGDVVFGATVAGRPAELPEVESILGMFVNNVPVRARFTGEELSGDWLRGFQEDLASLREHEWVSPLAIQEASDLPPGQRLFESLLVVQNYPADDAPAEGAGGDLTVTAVSSRLETGYPLTVVAGPLRPLSARLFFDTRRLDAVTAGRLGRQLGTLLQALAADPERRLGDLPLLTDAERHQILVEWNDAPWIAPDRLAALETEVAAVTVPTGETELSSELLPAFFERQGTTVMQAPPPLWSRLLDLGFRPPGGFTAVCVGAGLSPSLARELAAQGGSVLQVYALADGGRWLSARAVCPGDALEGPSLIGPPLEGAELHVLSADGRPQPVGVTGQLFAGGPAVASSGLVATGDLARRRGDGRIELLGRLEERIDLAGGAVDPGAVELELLRHAAVRAARVVPWQDAVGELHLVAYLVADRSALPRIEDLSATLLRRLPRFAVPDLYIRLGALPLAGDGRVDLPALPAPDQALGQLETP